MPANCGAMTNRLQKLGGKEWLSRLLKTRTGLRPMISLPMACLRYRQKRRRRGEIL